MAGTCLRSLRALAPARSAPPRTANPPKLTQWAKDGSARQASPAMTAERQPQITYPRAGGPH